MKKINQDQFGDKGNCFAACVASILELPLDAVPNLCQGDSDWFLGFIQWLDFYGLSSLNINIEQDNRELLLKKFCRGYHIAGVENDNGIKHAVVIKNGSIVWDPMPDCFKQITDSSRIVDVQIFIAINANDLVFNLSRWINVNGCEEASI